MLIGVVVYTSEYGTEGCLLSRLRGEYFANLVCMQTKCPCNPEPVCHVQKQVAERKMGVSERRYNFSMDI